MKLAIALSFVSSASILSLGAGHRVHLTNKNVPVTVTRPAPPTAAASTLPTAFGLHYPSQKRLARPQPQRSLHRHLLRFQARTNSDTNESQSHNPSQRGNNNNNINNNTHKPNDEQRRKALFAIPALPFFGGGSDENFVANAAAGVAVGGESDGAVEPIADFPMRRCV